MNIRELYADTVKYTKHLEEILKNHTTLDEEDLKHIRSKFIKPATNVVKDWLEGDNK